MKGGSKLLATAAILAVAGCIGDRPQLQIRPTATPLSATAKPVPFRIAEAYSELALGNVALAIESFRKALREQPDSVEAMAGLAACYDQMTRFDLSRRYYEAALAVTPADAGLLNAFARSLDRQGHSEEAAEVRREIGMRLAAAKPPPQPAIPTAVRPVTIVRGPAPVAGPSVTVALPAPEPLTAAPTKVAVVHGKPMPVRQSATAPAPAPKPVAIASAPASVMAAKPKPVLQVAATSAPAPLTGPVVAVAVPAPKPAATTVVVPVTPRTPAAATLAAAPPPTAAPIVLPIRTVDKVAAPLPPVPAPMAIARSASIEALPSLKAQTYLERLSPGEVVLVTTAKPRWRSQVVGRTAQSTTIRYVPLRTPQIRMVQVRLLNAARHQGLAARTRSLLANRGWRQLAIGDATRVRRTSLILYPPNRRSTAERLAKQFGFPIEKRASGNEFVMLIGQDATRITGARTGG